MHRVGHVESNIAVALNEHLLVLVRYGLRRQTRALQFQNDLGTIAGDDDVQRKVFAHATPRINVDLCIGQLIDGGDTIALNPKGLATGSGDNAPAHDQQAMLIARDVFFNNDGASAAFAVGQVVSRLHVALRAQIEGHSPAMVAVIGLHHHGDADLLCSFPGFFSAAHQFAFRHRHATGLEE